MKKLKNIFICENIATGYLYAYVHFITEIICFYVLAKITGNAVVLFLTPFIYDMLAFVPQSLIGYINDLFPKLSFGILGLIMMVIGLFMFELTSIPYLPVIIISIGNAFAHVAGAETTLRCSNGMLRHPAFFVAGGTYGIVVGKIFASINVSYWLIAFIVLSGIPFCLLADSYRPRNQLKKDVCKNFNYAKKSIKPMTVILLATFIVIVRGYMGYGIPVSWNKTMFQTVLLYLFLGTGKALGGILIDKIGMRKTAFISTLCALPFIIFGDNLMIVSLIGVMFFSMTMAITLGLLVSVLKRKPGLAFGYTTIGLFIGTIPIFIVKTTNIYLNAGILSVLTIICVLCLNYMIEGDKNDNNC